ncbi:MAG: IS21 family transposase [Acidobacteria bacterium]|nr:MAG: IS21 family transposase [Acidobacteriota bacterium]
MISEALAAEIRRLYEVEGWRRNTIARHLGVHHGTVERALLRAGVLRSTEIRRRQSILDPFVPFVRATLERYPELPASVLYEMVRRRGYPGGPDYFRHRLRVLGLRPRKAPEAFLRLRTLPGEQAQVDWAHFGWRAVDGGRRRLLAFVMVLSYSRALYVRFFYDARLPNFLAGHVQAFDAFGGMPRTLLYDNLKSAVLERRGEAIRFHPRLLELADHYGFVPRPVAPYRGHEKGRVERAIRYLRTSFFPLRRDWSLEALNRDAPRWCRERAAARPWPQDRRRTVAQALAEERAHLLVLPAEPFPCHEHVPVKLRRTPYVRFDANRYSVPHQRVQRPLVVVADLERVRVYDGRERIAEHRRAWGKGQVVEDPRHLRDLWQSKRRARVHRGQERLLRLVPRAEELLSALARRQRHLATAVARLLYLLDTYGQDELRRAVDEALDSGSPHPETVRLILDRRGRARGQEPPMPIRLPDDPKVRDLVVTPHPLADYDPDDPEDTP